MVMNQMIKMQLFTILCCVVAIRVLSAISYHSSHSDVGDVSTRDSKNPHNETSNESNITFSANRIVSGLEYLGSGYDTVKANTKGGIDTGEDLGHRAPIIDFYWARSDVGVTNSLKWLQPLGGWVRPITACGESDTVTEGAESSSNEDAVRVNAAGTATLTVGGGGTLDIGYTDLSKLNVKKSSKVYKTSYYCFTYAAGMPPYLDWETTEDFAIAINDLPYDVETFESCTVKLFKKKSKFCEGMSKWVEFFLQFGTHVTTEIQLGGKITRFLIAPTESMDSFSKVGLNVDVAVKAIISGKLVEAKNDLNSTQQKALQEFSDTSELKFSVLGGIHVSKSITPESLLKWKATVPLFPMPIRTIYTPLDVFLDSKYKHAYRAALNFYVELNGSLPWVVQKHNGITFNVETLINTSQPIVLASSKDSNVKIECPGHKRILFGFIMESDPEKHTFRLYSCKSNTSTCLRERIGNVQTVIWAICGNTMGLQFKQHALSFERLAKDKIVKCKTGYSLLTGFIVETAEDETYLMKSLTPCNTGAKECRSLSHLDTHIWAVCVDKRFPGLEHCKTLAQSDVNPTVVNLGANMRLLTGIRACYGSFNDVRLCERFSLGCRLETSAGSPCASFIWGIFLKEEYDK